MRSWMNPCIKKLSGQRFFRLSRQLLFFINNLHLKSILPVFVKLCCHREIDDSDDCQDEDDESDDKRSTLHLASPPDKFEVLFLQIINSFLVIAEAFLQVVAMINIEKAFFLKQRQLLALFILPYFLNRLFFLFLSG